MLRRLNSVSIFRWNLLSWAPSIDLVPIPRQQESTQNIYNVGYYVYCLYPTRIKCIITLSPLHVSALLGHHQVTKVYNYDIKVIPIQRIRCIHNIQHCEYTRRMYHHNITEYIHQLQHRPSTRGKTNVKRTPHKGVIWYVCPCTISRLLLLNSENYQNKSLE
jgi:hypothetical protein